MITVCCVGLYSARLYGGVFNHTVRRGRGRQLDQVDCGPVFPYSRRLLPTTFHPDVVVVGGLRHASQQDRRLGHRRHWHRSRLGRRYSECGNDPVTGPGDRPEQLRYFWNRDARPTAAAKGDPQQRDGTVSRRTRCGRRRISRVHRLYLDYFGSPVEARAAHASSGHCFRFLPVGGFCF